MLENYLVQIFYYVEDVSDQLTDENHWYHSADDFYCIDMSVMVKKATKKIPQTQGFIYVNPVCLGSKYCSCHFTA